MSAEQPQARRPRALVIDDSRAVRSIIRQILAELSFEVHEAEDGAAALKKVQELGGVDLATVDWNMPVMDGFEFLKELRKLPGGRDPKVVFCTTENDIAHIAKAMRAGADEYIMKPFDSEIVESKLSQVGLL